MRTQEEIVARIESRKGNDFFGFEVDEYILFLDYTHAKPYLEDGVTENGWEQENHTPIEIIIDYMPFAWEKANNCRGMSANRSISHFIAWLWLDGDSGWLDKDYDNHYKYYGKPQLVKICEKYGIDWHKLDDDRWANSESEKGITANQALTSAKLRKEDKRWRLICLPSFLKLRRRRS